MERGIGDGAPSLLLEVIEGWKRDAGGVSGRIFLGMRNGGRDVV